MALDPRIALMGRSVEVPDAVVRRGQRAHARLVEDQDEALRRQAEDEAQIDLVMRQTGGDLSPGTIARTFGINWKAGQALSKLATDRAKADAEIATQTATQAYRGSQTANQQQQTQFAAEVQPSKVATEAANASIAGQKAGTVAPAGDLASQFAQRAAMNARNLAQQQQAETQTETIIPFDDFATAFKQANPNATPVDVQFAYERRKLAPPKQVPGVDVPFSADVARQKMQITAAGRAPAANGGAPDDVTQIANAIINGHQPPTLTGLYRNAAPVRAALERAGYDFTTAERDYKAVQKHLSTLNGAQQERLRQAVSFTTDSLDIIDQLYNEWSSKGLNTRFKAFNKASLAAAKQLGGEAGATAQALEAQVNDLVSELGTVYKGGNSSTDHSLQLAAENLKTDWNEATFKKALGLIRQNLKIRANSIATSQPAGVSPDSPYIPAGQRPTPGKAADPMGIR